MGSSGLGRDRLIKPVGDREFLVNFIVCKYTREHNSKMYRLMKIFKSDHTYVTTPQINRPSSTSQSFTCACYVASVVLDSLRLCGL